MNTRTEKALLNYLILLLLTVAIAALTGLSEHAVAESNSYDYVYAAREEGSSNYFSTLAMGHSGNGSLEYLATENENNSMISSGTCQSTGQPMPAGDYDTGIIKGSVRSAENGKPISRPWVYATHASPSAWQSVYGDHDGRYEIEVPALPDYRVGVNAYGYESASKYNVEVRKNSSTIVNFELDEYIRVKFDLNGAPGMPPATQIFVDPGYVRRPANPIRGGYIFRGWYANRECWGIPWFDISNQFKGRKVANSLTLYAKWEQRSSPTPYDHYSFDNHYDYFTTPRTRISDEYYNICNYSALKLIYRLPKNVCTM